MGTYRKPRKCPALNIGIFGEISRVVFIDSLTIYVIWAPTEFLLSVNGLKNIVKPLTKL